jgi:zona occludens toxin
MSIIAYVGLPGSGKSYGVVENVVIPALKDGRTIVTNIPLKKGYLSDDFPKGNVISFSSNDPDNDPDFWNIEKYAGAIWIVDEVQHYWPSGIKANAVPKIEKAFFTEHRHCVGHDGKTSEIVLVTQNLKQIASFVRELVEDTYRTSKHTALGTTNRYRVDVFTGAETRQKGGDPVRSLQGKYKKDVFKYYSSHTKNKTDFAAGMEQKVDNRNNVWKSPIIKFGIPFAFLMLWYSFSVISDRFFGEKETPTPETVEEIKEDSQISPVNKSKPIRKEELPRHIAAAESMKKMDISREYLPLSDTHRIVADFGDQLLLWSETATRTVKKRLCGTFSNTREDYCVLNGQLVTWYSSRIPEEDLRQYDFIPDATEDLF